MSVISTVLGLKDNVSPSLSKIERQAIANLNAYKKLETEGRNLARQMKELAANGLEDTTMYKGLESATYKTAESMAELAEGSKNAKLGFDNEKASVDPLTNSLLRLAKAYIGIQGARKLISLSDIYIQTHARLGMITDDVDKLEKQIYQSAQRSRVSTQSLSETVSKLGMQAKDAFGGSTDQILKFTETLNKAFVVSGMDANSIRSVMYNMTQSLSTGHLLGNDYRILKMNAPMIVKYLREYYGDIAQSELDALVSAGKVTAQDLKNAMFKAADDIDNKFNEMPVTFEQAWTKLTNTVQRMLIPVLKVLSTLAGGLDKIFTFLSEHQYILYILAGFIGLVTTRMMALNAVSTITSVVTKLVGNSAAIASLKFALFAAVILAVVGVLLYFWNTNDKAAEGMLKIWDSFLIGMKLIALGITSLLYGLVKIVETTVSMMLAPIIQPINAVISAMNAIDGGHRATIKVDFLSSKLKSSIDSQVQDITDTANKMNTTRSDRVANRKRIGYEQNIAEDLGNISSLITNDSTGGSALKTTTSDNLLKQEDIQLLLDVATRDFKLNYQQITPEIAVTFGDVHESADVEQIMDKIADAIDEVWEKDLEVVSFGT